MEHPDFYLTSSEGYDLEEPRSCKRLRRIGSERRDDLLLVQIEPPIVGQKFGLGAKDIDIVALATRYKGDSLFPIREWPVFVHVARLIGEGLEGMDVIGSNRLQEIAWAELYETEDAARRKDK